MCLNAGIIGDIVLSHITEHSLRGRMIQWLMDAGHSDANIMKRTTHKSLESLDNYNHLFGRTGIP